MPNKHRNPSQDERDERIVLPLDPETALRGLLAVDPDDEADEPVVEVGQSWHYKGDPTDVITVHKPALNVALDSWTVLVAKTGVFGRMTSSEIISDYALVRHDD